ncbi:MAG: bifunctional UDP-N-acetylmuramoyl-tripeptide:D-alanyl-D-alanine ligase/alanine racemase [Bacteroidetes bacterium]|nr:bifunctional UDP-N-acetylmuramoyl-tripeptide:D-alanyl-D-alanine ligase/alanine racemase [Bacteroidota bacterium]
MGVATAKQLQTWGHGTWLSFFDNSEIEDLCIDSRKINGDPNHTLFIAIQSSRRDGHQYIESAYRQGVRNFLVHQHIPTQNYPEANFLCVNDTKDALQKIVAAYRRQFSLPVFGITGSNGKTVVKEWLFQLLSDNFNIVRNPKSYNSQIGVPLAVWLIEPDHNLGIFEAGISQPGEMENLETIIHPDIGIFTNIGEAHSEGFLNQRQKINEKLVLFRHAKQLIYCSDNPDLNECIVSYQNQIKNAEASLQLFTWSQKHDADLKIIKIEKTLNQSHISAFIQGKEFTITIPFNDAASIENAIHCWCALHLLNKPHSFIQEKMSGLHSVAMRLELRHGINDCTIINDTYNSDLTSLQIALDFLEQQKQHQQHTLILSDMMQMGKSDLSLYEEVSELVDRRKVQRLIGVGIGLYKHRTLFKSIKKLKSIFFKSTEDLLKQFHLLQFENEAILLKGARSFRFEKIGRLLEQKIHQTTLSINLSAISQNLNVFRGLLKPSIKLMAMVKAFSYGSGSFEIAHLLQFAGVDYLTVAYTDEGIALRKAGITMPIMVMSPDNTSFDLMIAWKLEPEIYNMRSLTGFLAMAKTLQAQHYPIHIKLDTGMHRLGFMEQDISELTETLQNTSLIKVQSIFSHLAASDDPAFDYFTLVQAKRFDQMSQTLINALNYQPLRHLCNSAGIVRHPSLHYDMVRLGIGLYGVDNSEKNGKKLVQVSTLKTTIAQIKQIDAGETIGYGRRGKVEAPKRIATVSIGYADGYPRAIANSAAYMLVQGKPAPIIGSVCMDMCMLDISSIPDSKEGDEVVVFGASLPVTQLAKWANTIPYEIMTGISQRVKRVYVEED